MKIERGDVIEINGEKYDVCTYFDEIDWYDAEKKEWIGEHDEFTLNKIGSKKLNPTHLLKIYKDKDKSKGILLYKISEEKPTKLSGRGATGWQKFVDERKINPNSIKVIKD